MKKTLLIIFVFIQYFSYSQTFTSSNVVNIVDAGGAAVVNIGVNGVTPTVIDGNFGLEKVCINITHPDAGDMRVILISPSGKQISLFNFSQTPENYYPLPFGANYVNTCFDGESMNSVTNLNASGAPYTGNYRPMESLGHMNDGQNPNGVWQLKVWDNKPYTAGGAPPTQKVNSWSITFSSNPVPPVVCNSNNPVPNDLCTQATLINNMEGYCGTTSNSYHSDPGNQPGELDDNQFCGTIENNSWIKFVASNDTAILDVRTYNCTKGTSSRGIQMRIFETTNCVNFTPVSNCTSVGRYSDFIITATSLTPGETYYIMIDGWQGDVCDYIIGALFGVDVSAINATLKPDKSICAGECTDITEDVTGGYAKYKIEWFENNNPAPFAIDTTTSATPVIKNVCPTTTTNYKIIASTIDTTFVSDTANITITVNLNPIVLLNDTTNICEGSTTTLTSNITGDTYAWYWNSSLFGVTQSVTATNEGNYVLELTSNNCSGKDSTYLKFINSIWFNIGSDTALCFNSPYVLNANYTGSNLSYNWYLNDGLIATNTETIDVTNEGSYALIIIDNGGCQFADTVNIGSIDCEITIPNVITPNTDGTNDYFEITNLDKYPSSPLLIYNRWGKKIYESSDYKNDWNGDGCSEGTYYYIFTLSNTTKYTGTVTVLY
ncbi:MAG: gliding motility-associated C-terminal domain-containing protein [Bacteroidota bacterium]